MSYFKILKNIYDSQIISEFIPIASILRDSNCCCKSSKSQDSHPALILTLNTDTPLGIELSSIN
ncbi:MAG: hypothetical protein AAF673_00410, partial [Pseudomonadota bacterium]